MVFKRSTSVDIFTKQIKDYLSDDFIIVKKETDIGVAIEKLKNEQDDQQFAAWSIVLFEQALLAEGGRLPDPGSFVKRMNALLEKMV